MQKIEIGKRRRVYKYSFNDVLGELKQLETNKSGPQKYGSVYNLEEGNEENIRRNDSLKNSDMF